MIHDIMLTTISKGQQITIPAEMRNKLKLQKGSRVEISLVEDKIVITPLRDDLETIFKETKNIKPRYNLTAEQMDELNEKMIHEIHR